MLARNLATNPRFAGSIATYGGSAQGGAIVYDPTVGHNELGSGKITRGVAANVGVGGEARFVTQSATFTANNVASAVVAWFYTNTAGQSVVTEFAGDSYRSPGPVFLTPGQWTRVVAVLDLQKWTANTIQWVIRGMTGDATGTPVWVDDVTLLDDASTIVEFTGDSPLVLRPGGRSLRATWEGTPDASVSRLETFTIDALDEFYDGLPDHYRDADENVDYALYRWLAGPLNELDAVTSELDGIDVLGLDEGGTPGDTSTLTDPRAAPISRLPWLAQLVGVQLRPDFTEAEARDAVGFASAGWRAGTKQSIADAARTELQGTRYARVYDHSVTNPGDGGPFDVLIITRGSETADANRVLQAVIRRAAKPAGVVLRTRVYEGSWDTLTTAYPTWAAVESSGSWDELQEAGL